MSITDDSIDESDETITITISNASDGTISDATGTVTITDNDATPSLSINDVSTTNESSTSTNLTVTLSAASAQDVTVDFTTAYPFVSTAADAGSDYNTTNGTLTISAGDTTGTIPVTVIQDNIFEEDEVLYINLSNPTNATISDARGVLTITDDESRPTATLTVDATSIDENSGSSLTLTATLTGPTKGLNDVYLDTSGTATEGTDYTDGSGVIDNIRISAGSTTGTVTFNPTDDSVYEGNETAIISVNTVSGLAVENSTPQAVTITITENESSPTITLTSSASSISENAGSSLTLTATSSIVADEDITVSISTSGTGTEGTDYSTISDITISAGATTGTASFTPTDDSVYEGNETGIVAISGVSGADAAESGTQSVTITITENESAPTVTLTSSASSINENAGSSLTLTATLSGAVDETVTVSIGTAGTSTEGTDYTDGSGAVDDITISAGATTGTVSFTPTDDSIYEGDETAIISIDGVSGGGASESGTQSVTLTITENESSPTVTLATSASSIDENSGSTLTLTATISQAADEDVTVNLGLAGTSTNGTDYGSLSSITVSAGATTGTATFDPTDDSIYEGNETAVVSISSVSGADAAESGSQSVTITITDNETTAPTVTLATSATSIAENAGSSLTLTATLSVATTADVTVELSTSGTATEGTDYTDGSGNIDDIVISAGSTTGTVNFTPTDDSIYDATSNETATIFISDVSGGSASENSTPQTVTITITDNESAPTVSLSSSASTIDENGGGSITITATASVATFANISVPITMSGTATEGTDYNNGSTVSDITISAGATTGTATLTPVADTNYENGSETAIANITVSGGGASENGSQSVTITITNKALDSGTQNSYSSSTATAWLSEVEFSQSGLNSDDDPYKNINLHKALAYSNGSGLMLGSGEVIAIMDSGFMINGAGSNNTTHQEFNGKTITALNATYFTLYNSSSNSHGTGVAGVALGNYGTGASMGVAPAADLHIHQYNLTGTAASYANWWALGTDDAKSDGAVVQNNSWGFDDSQTLNAGQTAYNASWAINDYVTYKSNNSLTSSATLAAHASLDNDGNGANDVWASNTAAQWDTYVASLNSFQQTGVVVFALSNNSTFDDADVSAALPELYPELEEAWITVANVEIDGTGAMSGKTYTLQSAPCGSTAEYCLAADGTDILMPGGSQFLSGSFYYKVATGTSFAAPQVSGAVALLATHFPNHSPEQLTDRLLASAYNDWAAFGVDGTVTFGNGVVHGYSTDYGHGIMDIGKTDYKNILYKKSFSDDEDLEKQLAVTLGYSALPVQSFFNFEQMALNGITEYNLPFLDQQDQGLSLNTLIGSERFKFSLSSTTPVKQQTDGGEVIMGGSTSLMSTMEYTFNEDVVLGLLSGFVEEREGFLGLEGNEAFSLDNSSNISKFNSLKIQKNIKDDLALTLTGTLAYSDFEGDKSSLLKSGDNILSESYSLTLNKANLFGNDNFAISISQPKRVKDGSLTLRLSDLADQDGNINIRDTEVDLEPSGRQIDTSFAYTKDISEDFTLSLKATITDEFNHIKDNEKHYSGYIGLNFENLKIGISDATNISRPSVQMKYRKEF